MIMGGIIESKAATTSTFFSLPPTLMEEKKTPIKQEPHLFHEEKFLSVVLDFDVVYELEKVDITEKYVPVPVFYQCWRVFWVYH